MIQCSFLQILGAVFYTEWIGFCILIQSGNHQIFAIHHLPHLTNKIGEMCCSFSSQIDRVFGIETSKKPNLVPTLYFNNFQFDDYIAVIHFFQKFERDSNYMKQKKWEEVSEVSFLRAGLGFIFQLWR